MRIVMLSTYDAKGGAARAAYRLHRGMLHAGIDSCIVVQKKTSDDVSVLGPETRAEKAISMLRPHLDALPVSLYRSRQQAMFYPCVVPDFLSKRISSLRADIVHLHWVSEGFLRPETLKRIRKPIVWSLHDSWPFTGGCHVPEDCTRYRESCGKCPVLGSGRTHDLSQRTWSRKKNAWDGLNITVIAPSRWMADSARSSSLFKGLRIEVIPNGLELTRYKPIDKKLCREILSLPIDKKIILFGAFNTTSDKNKGFQFLGPVLKKIREDCSNQVELLVFGASEPPNAPQFGMKTRYLGRLHDDISLSLVYSAADVMVVPSIQESFGLTAQEAMACGTPVVSFASTGLLDIVEHKQTGYLARPFDPADLAAGICWILKNPGQGSVLSQKARKKVESEFAIEQVVNRYVGVYRDILKQP